MKILTCCLLFTWGSIVTSIAQVKMFPGGVMSVGTVSPPPSGFRLNVVGESIFRAHTGTITSAAYIRGLNTYSTAMTPDFTWWGNDQTGIFHPCHECFAISTKGLERFRVDDHGQAVFTNDANFTGATLLYLQPLHFGAIPILSKYNGTASFYVTAYGHVYHSGLFQLSDSTVKENIVPVTGALAKVLQMRGVYYNRKKEGLADSNDWLTILPGGNMPTELGLLAQEVETIVPEVVVTREDGKKALAYQSLVALLIEAIKEQQERMDLLEEQLLHCCSPGENPARMYVAPEEEYIMETVPGQEEEDINLLEQNIPNPFSHHTIIRYQASYHSRSISVLLFDMQGKLVFTYANLPPGSGQVDISAGILSPGMYMYALVIDGREIDTKRMILTEG